LVNQYNATLSAHTVIKDTTLWICEQSIEVTGMTTNIGGTLTATETAVNPIGTIHRHFNNWCKPSRHALSPALE
jgi:hypothetical protein